MSFEIRVNGETVWETDDHVLDVSVQSARGELARVGTAIDDAVLNIVANVATDGGPMRLDHLEALQREQARSFREGATAGTVAEEVTEETSLHGSQGEHTATVIESEKPLVDDDETVVNDDEFAIQN
jgi:hypothetical protein